MNGDERVREIGSGPEVAFSERDRPSLDSGTGAILTPALRSVLDQWDDAELRSRLCGRLVSFHRAERRASGA